MKLDVEEDSFIVYLNKDYIQEIDFKIKKQVETCFKGIFNKIRRRLNKDINGFFSIKVFLNNEFGAILLLNKEELEYYDYFANQVDMQIEIEYDAKILLEFEDILNMNITDTIVYLYNNKYYINYIKDIKYVEFANVIYGDKAEFIINNATIIDKVCDM